MELIIKKAKITDLPLIQELNRKLFQKEYKDYDSSLNLNWTFGEKGTEYFKKRLSGKNGCILIASAKDKIVGYLAGGLNKKRLDFKPMIVAELESIFVLEKYRSKEAGQNLYQEFVKWCYTKNVEKIKVKAFFRNKRAIKFYKANKFKECYLDLEANL